MFNYIGGRLQPKVSVLINEVSFERFRRGSIAPLCHIVYCYRAENNYLAIQGQMSEQTQLSIMVGRLGNCSDA